jgi:hypothetical protein
MALSVRTRGALAGEGIVLPEDLADFKDLDTVYSNLRKPPKIMGYPTVNDRTNRINGVLVDQEPFSISAKSRLRLDVALTAVKYYETINRPLDTDNMSWATLKNFEIEHTALLERKDDTEAPVPKLDKNLTVPKWLESVKIHLSTVLGKRGIPLSYVVRPDETVAAVPPPLLAQQAYSEEHGSVEAELIARSSHTHALFRQDSRDVFERLERATRGNANFSGTITSFRRTKNGRGAFKAYETQHAGKDVWESLIKKAETFIQNTKWNGLSNIKFIAHAAKHRSSYIDMTEAKEHVAVECPNERSRVTYLLNSIESKDPDLLAAVAAIKQDEAGKRSHFEDAVAFIIPTCPVEAKHAKKAHFNASVSSTNGINAKLKSGIGKTGVELRFHKNKDFWALPEEQRQEVREYTAAMKAAGKIPEKRKGGGGDSPPNNKKRKASISSAVAKATKKQNEVMHAMATTLSHTQAALASLSAQATGKSGATVSAVTIAEPPATPPNATDTLMQQANASALKLQGILKKQKKVTP